MRRRGRFVALALVAVALAAGCAADVDDEPLPAPADALTLPAGTDVDLTGAPVAVGSRAGATDEVLGWIAVELLTAAGAEVTDDLGIGDAVATREAQLAGLVDLTWERTGVGWLSLLREIGPSADPRQLYEDVRDEDLDENGIVWFDPAPADLGRAVVAAPDTVEDLDLATLGELAAALGEREEGVVVCVARSEEVLDPEGLLALAEATGLRLRPAEVVPVPADRLLALVEEGTFCPFGLVSRLHPDLAGAEVEALADDVGAFVAQQPAVTVREDTLELVPGLEDLVAPAAAALDTETLAALTAEVTRDGRDPRDVARDWLEAEELAVP